MTSVSATLSFAGSISGTCILTKLGQAPNNDYRGGHAKINPKVYGPVFYRHSEGAVIGSHNAHAEHMKKEKIFVLDDRNACPKNTGVRASSGLASLYQVISPRKDDFKRKIRENQAGQKPSLVYSRVSPQIYMAPQQRKNPA